MNRNFFYILLMVTIFTQTAFACMPNSPADVFIARYESIQKNSTDPLKFNLVLDRQDFIFRTLYQRLTLNSPEKNFSDFKPQGLIRDNLVIGFAYNPDGRVPKRYQLSALAK